MVTSHGLSALPSAGAEQDLSNCLLSALPDALTNLSSVLTHLDISGKPLQAVGNLPLLRSLPNLRHLSLAHTGLRLGPEVAHALAASCTQLTLLNVAPVRMLSPPLSSCNGPWKQLLDTVVGRCVLPPPSLVPHEARADQPIPEHEWRRPEQPPGREAVEAAAADADRCRIRAEANTTYLSYDSDG